MTLTVLASFLRHNHTHIQIEAENNETSPTYKYDPPYVPLVELHHDI